MTRCEECSKDFKDARGLAAHDRFKHGRVVQGVAPAPVELPTAPSSQPAILDELRQAGIRISSSGRSVKMLRPICATCQQGKEVPVDWWKRCRHNPYISVRQVSAKTPIYEDLPDGRKKLLGEETILDWVEQPNWVQIAVRPRIDSGTRLERKRVLNGFIFPEDLRTPLFPDGIANPCEYRNCFRQKDVKQYRWGRFCRRIEAQVVGHDMRMEGGGGALEIYSLSPQSVEKQRNQLEQVPV